MATVSSPNQPLDTLHDAFTQEEIDNLRNEDLLAGYRVSGVLIAVVTFGCFIGTLGVWLATQ